MLRGVMFTNCFERTVCLSFVCL